MRYSSPARQVFYRQQMRRIVELVQRCDDAQSVAAVLQAATYCIEKTEGRPLSSEGSLIAIAELNRSVLH
jgi:hypothetical protein